MNLTPQQEKILRVLLTTLKNSASPAQIRDAYEQTEGKMGNVHQQLKNMMGEGAVKRTGDSTYSITEAGIAQFNKKKTEETPNIRFTTEETAQITELAKQPDVLTTLTENFATNLIGLEKEKLACLISAVSDRDIGNYKNRIHILFTGPPSCGKSQLLKATTKQLWGFYCDSNTSAAGLRGTTAGSQFRPGIIQDSNGSSLAIDELDKFKPIDQAALLTAMQDGKTTTTKEGGERTDEAQIRVIAAANHADRIIEELRSRFDIIIDIPTITRDKEEEIIRIKTNEWNRKKDAITEELLKKYMTYARQYESKYPEDREQFYEHIIRERQTGSLQKCKMRQLESIWALTLAIAKLQLKKEVDLQCLSKAIEVLT